VSALANHFVADPREVVKSGQVVRVKVLEADPERKRISLTLRLDDEPAGAATGSGRRGPGAEKTERGGKAEQPGKPEQPGKAGQPGEAGRGGRPDRQQPGRQARGTGGGRPAPKPEPVNTAMAEALRKAGLGK
jgi:uncharacterized protein